MSSSPTVRTSTTASSANSRSRPEVALALIACGALAGDVRLVANQAPVRTEVHTLNALLHNRPAEIAPAVEALATQLMGEGKAVAVAYGDCGTYGALDAVCDRLGIERLPGSHCYDVIAGEGLVASLLAEEPGTYLLTDFLLKGFRRLVIAELGLDRHPELVADYFGNYRRLVWLTERPTPALEDEAGFVARLLGLELEIRRVGEHRLAGSVVRLVAKATLP